MKLLRYIREALEDIREWLQDILAGYINFSWAGTLILYIVLGAYITWLYNVTQPPTFLRWVGLVCWILFGIGVSYAMNIVMIYLMTTILLFLLPQYSEDSPHAIFIFWTAGLLVYYGIMRNEGVLDHVHGMIGISARESSFDGGSSVTKFSATRVSFFRFTLQESTSSTLYGDRSGYF
jgi:hypothetical protein